MIPLYLVRSLSGFNLFR